MPNGFRRDRPPRTALCYPPTLAVTVMPPLGLGYLAACAEAAGFPVDLYDLAGGRWRRAAFPQMIAAQDYDIVGLSVMTPNFQTGRELARAIRRAHPRVKLVLGGPHPSVFPERSLREFDADFVVEKEAERTFPALLQSLASGADPVGRVPGVWAWRDGKLTGLPAPSPPELDELPWPAWHKLAPHRYPPIPHQLFVRALPVAPILTSRGCPMGCSFCATSYLFGKKIRTRAVPDVVEEMRFLRDRFGIRELHFEDDNLCLDRRHAVALFEALARARLGVWLKCPNGLQTSALDRELLRLLKAAGCYQISLGIETTAESALEHEQKLLPVAEVSRVVAEAKSAGLEVQGLFVVGLPYDSSAGVHRTVRDAIAMGLDLAHFGVFIPLPGSERGDLLAGCDIGTVNFFTPHVAYPHLSPRRLRALQRWAILRFYLRPRPVWKLLTLFKWRQLKGVVNLFRRYLLGF